MENVLEKTGVEEGDRRGAVTAGEEKMRWVWDIIGMKNWLNQPAAQGKGLFRFQSSKKFLLDETWLLPHFCVRVLGKTIILGLCLESGGKGSF